MVSIGGVSFLTKQGPSTLEPLETVEEISRDNVDGHAFRRRGQKSEPVEWITEADVDDPEFTQLLYHSMQGEIVTVVDEDATDTDDVMIVKVEVIGKKKIVGAVGGITAGSWMVTARWILQGC